MEEGLWAQIWSPPKRVSALFFIVIESTMRFMCRDWCGGVTMRRQPYSRWFWKSGPFGCSWLWTHDASSSHVQVGPPSELTGQMQQPCLSLHRYPFVSGWRHVSCWSFWHGTQACDLCSACALIVSTRLVPCRLIVPCGVYKRQMMNRWSSSLRSAGRRRMPPHLHPLSFCGTQLGMHGRISSVASLACRPTLPTSWWRHPSCALVRVDAL